MTDDYQPAGKARSSAYEKTRNRVPTDFGGPGREQPPTPDPGEDLERRAVATKGRARSIEAVGSRAYDRADLSRYSLKDRFVIRVADCVFFALIGMVCRTVRWETRGMQHLESIFDGGRRAIFTFWHSCIFSATWVWRKRGIVVMSSQSRDGEFVGRVIQRFGYGTARGSSSRRAGRALAEMAECLDVGIDVAFTIDGPRGPAFVAKTGAVTLAKHTGHAVLPFHITGRRRVVLPSWDRTEIVAPFTKGLVLIGEPISLPRESSEAVVEQVQAALQSSLDDLRRQAETWRLSKST